MLGPTISQKMLFKTTKVIAVVYWHLSTQIKIRKLAISADRIRSMYTPSTNQDSGRFSELTMKLGINNRFAKEVD